MRSTRSPSRLRRDGPRGFAAATSLASYIFGGIGYAFIIAMAATSFDRTAQAIGPRAWRILHLTGGYYLWFQFMVSFGKRIPDMPLYGLFLIPLLVGDGAAADRDGLGTQRHGRHSDGDNRSQAHPSVRWYLRPS